MSITLQSDENGVIHIPPHIIPGGEPKASYRIEEHEGQLIISKEPKEDSEESRGLKHEPEVRVKALRDWLEKARTDAGLSDYAVSRESIYD